MTTLSAQSIEQLCRGLTPLVSPFVEKTVWERTGTSYGLSACTYDVRLKQDLIIRPGDGELGSTIERFIIPYNVNGEVKNKSSVARIFISAGHDTLLDPGWEGYLTLEIVNQSRSLIELHAGQPIAQIKFEWLDRPTNRPYMGKYQNQPDEPVPALSELVR